MPYNPREEFDTTIPPESPNGKLYVRSLQVTYMDSQVFISDREGFLCSFFVHTDSGLYFLRDLLQAQAAPQPDPYGRRRYWPKARDLIHPGHAEAAEARALAIDNAIPPRPAGASQSTTKRARPTIEDLFS